jgi:hypothetical protein
MTVGDRPGTHRLQDSVAARIYEQRKQAFRCIVSDPGETHRFRTVDAKWQKVLDPQLFRTSQGREVSWFCIEA